MAAPATTTESATPEAAPSVSAQPSAVQRATPPSAKSEDGSMSSHEAAKFLKSRRAERNKLRLVPEGQDTSDEPTTETDRTPLPPEEDAGSSETVDDKPPEVEPTWAQKLRTDLGKKTERVAELEKQHQAREAKFTEAARTVRYQVEDLQADIKAEQSYSAMLEQAIAEAGFVVPADWKRAALAERKAERLERHLARGQRAQASQGHEKSAEAARQQVLELAKQIPEIGAALAGKDPEAKKWLAERFAVDENGKAVGLGMKNLEKDALAFAKALRWDRHSKAQASKRPPSNRPGEEQRPSSTTLSGSTSNAGTKRAPTVPKTEKESAAWLAQRRAARK